MNKFIVFLGEDENDVFKYYFNKQENRPFKEYYRNYMQCNDEIHAWMLENNIEYDIDFNLDSFKIEYFVIFKFIDDAILFKLSWGGK